VKVYRFLSGGSTWRRAACDMTMRALLCYNHQIEQVTDVLFAQDCACGL
jgi:hypothetical protein